MLTRITLSHFRNYHRRSFAFSPAITLLTGKNMAGKTNVLEAVALLAFGKSFRAKKETEMLRWESEIGSVSGIWQAGNDQTKLEVRMTHGMVNGKKTQIKKYSVNEIPRRQIDFIGNVRVVLFWPEDMKLVIDSPSIRRKYLDSVLVQVDREYRRNLFSYERGLRQRNRLLDRIHEGKANRSQLVFWNQLLIRSGQYISSTRERFLSAINLHTIGNAVYRVEYDKSSISEARLVTYADQEIAARTTLVGPHRDDFIVYEIIGSIPRDVSRFGSRGEQRLAVLWMKLAELEYITSCTQSRPTLLLDDIFSELDDIHKHVVLHIAKKQQTIITSADEATENMLHGHSHEIIRL